MRARHWMAMLACVLACGCGSSREVAVAPGLDRGLVGVWRPVVLRNQPLADTVAERSLFSVRSDGVATLLLEHPRGRSVTYQRLTTEAGRVTAYNLLSGKTTTRPYTIEGDRLTIGEGEAREQFVRRDD